MPAVLVEAGRPKGRRCRAGDEALHNANGGWGRGVGQRSKLEVHTERRGLPVEWKMEEGGREGGEGRGGEREEGRMEGSRGVSEGERESRVGVAASPLDCY